jgi:hypothetical protein
VQRPSQAAFEGSDRLEREPLGAQDDPVRLDGEGRGAARPPREARRLDGDVEGAGLQASRQSGPQRGGEGLRGDAVQPGGEAALVPVPVSTQRPVAAAGQLHERLGPHLSTVAHRRGGPGERAQLEDERASAARERGAQAEVGEGEGGRRAAGARAGGPVRAVREGLQLRSQRLAAQAGLDPDPFEPDGSRLQPAVQERPEPRPQHHALHRDERWRVRCAGRQHHRAEDEAERSAHPRAAEEPRTGEPVGERGRDALAQCRASNPGLEGPP